jgi:uncharacterized protein (DUF362 family)/NAD-dependent dihydropyrimidine dehydrogenase PreA subunit
LKKYFSEKFMIEKKVDCMSAFLNVKSCLTYNDYDLIRNTIEKSLERISLSSNPLRAGQTVVLKVNIVGPYPPEKAACTHPEVVRALVDALKKYDVIIKIVEDCPHKNAPKVSDILKVAEEAGVEFINLNDRAYKEIEVNGNIINYYEDIYNADHLILVPKMKTHILTNFSGSIKLMYGSITKAQRVAFHRFSESDMFANILVDIFSIKRPTLTVMDAIVSMDGVGPTQGNPNNSGLLLVSDDAVMMDYYASLLMKYKPMDIDMIKIAIETGISNQNPEDIEFLGDNVFEYDGKFTLMPTFKGAMKQKYIRMAWGIPKLLEEKCIMCGVCIKSCPFNAIHIQDSKPFIDSQECKQCFCCMELCSEGAYVFGKSQNK